MNIKDESDDTRIVEGAKTPVDESTRLAENAAKTANAAATAASVTPAVPCRDHCKPKKDNKGLWITIVAAFVVVIAIACLYFFVIKPSGNVDNKGNHSDDDEFENFGRMRSAFDGSGDMENYLDMASIDISEEIPEEIEIIEEYPEPVIGKEIVSERNQPVVMESTKTTAGSSYGTDNLNKKPETHEVVEEKPKEVEKPKYEEPVNMAMVEQKPQFPGGDAAMYKWLSQNINYPAQASEEGISGKVYIQFVVEKDGSITNAQVARSKHPALDAEAVRIVRNMPRWSPGRNNGQPVRVTYILPVTFRLE